MKYRILSVAFPEIRTPQRRFPTRCGGKGGGTVRKERLRSTRYGVGWEAWSLAVSNTSLPMAMILILLPAAAQAYGG